MTRQKKEQVKKVGDTYLSEKKQLDVAKKTAKQNQMNKSKKAVALSYNQQTDEAPIVKAKGFGRTAEEIINRAKEHHIAIQEDASLVELLSQLQLDQQIPEALYAVTAELLAMVYKLEQKAATNEAR